MKTYEISYKETQPVKSSFIQWSQ